MTQILKVMNWNRSGFTLIEIIIVLVIISLFLGLGLPKVLESFAESNISKAARDISLFIEQTRTNCILKKKDTYILFDITKNRISTPGLDNKVREKKINIPNDIEMRIEYQNKDIFNGQVKVVISNFGYISPLKIFLQKEGHNNIIIEVAPFLLQNKIIYNS
ncbi:prepilin-type N-terminal cleavage/methylation domain-containing protein [Desulfothermus okinawensis]